MTEKTTILTRIILVLLVLTIIFLSTSGSLFFRGSSKTKFCPLFYTGASVYPSDSYCLFSIWSKGLSVVALIIVIILFVIKRFSITIKENVALTAIFWIIKFTILVITTGLILVAAVVLSSGWGVTTTNINVHRNESFYEITASIVFSCLSVVTIILAFISAIILAIKE